VIVRISSEGQYNLPGPFVDRLNEIDNELVEAVRTSSGITHRKAQQVVGTVLQFLKMRVPQCEEMMDGLFAALEKAMVSADCGGEGGGDGGGCK